MTTLRDVVIIYEQKCYGTKIVKNHYIEWLSTLITFDLVYVEAWNYS